MGYCLVGNTIDTLHLLRLHEHQVKIIKHQEQDPGRLLKLLLLKNFLL